MWPIPACEYEYVTVSFSSDSIVCSWIQKTKNGLAPLALRAHERYDLNNAEIVHGTLFNLTTIKNLIDGFLRKHDKQDALILFSIDATDSMEQFVALPTSTPHRADFGVAHSSNLLWGHQYMYPNDHGQFVFYVYTVPRSVILQYQLLALALRCNLMAITTNTMALLAAYRAVFGSAFRRSQLAVDMVRFNNHVQKMVSDDALKRLITVPMLSELYHDRVSIAVACGLFYDE